MNPIDDGTLPDHDQPPRRPTPPQDPIQFYSTWLESQLSGQWVTNFDVQFPDDEGGFIPTSILSEFHFDTEKRTFKAWQLRNKGGVIDNKQRSGTYQVVAEGIDDEIYFLGTIHIHSSGSLCLKFFFKNTQEIHWLLSYDAEPSLPMEERPVPARSDIPVAQGVMHKVDLPRMMFT